MGPYSVYVGRFCTSTKYDRMVGGWLGSRWKYSIIINIFLPPDNDYVRGLSYFTIYPPTFKTLVVRWAGGVRVFYSYIVYLILPLHILLKMPPF
jgi:hypothetical protein